MYVVTWVEFVGLQRSRTRTRGWLVTNENSIPVALENLDKNRDESKDSNKDENKDGKKGDGKNPALGLAMLKPCVKTVFF